MVFLLALLGCFGSSNSSTISRGPSEKIWMKTDSDYLVANGKDFVTLSSNVDNPTFYYFLKGKEEGKKLSGSTFSIIEPGDYEIIVKQNGYDSNPITVKAIPGDIDVSLPFSRKRPKGISRSKSEKINYPGLTFSHQGEEVDISDAEQLLALSEDVKNLGVKELDISCRGFNLGKLNVLINNISIDLTVEEGKGSIEGEDIIISAEGVLGVNTDYEGDIFAYLESIESNDGVYLKSLKDFPKGSSRLLFYVEFEGKDFLIYEYEILSVPSLYSGFELFGEKEIGEAFPGQVLKLAISDPIDFTWPQEESYISFHDNAAAYILPMVAQSGKREITVKYEGRNVGKLVIDYKKEYEPLNVANWNGLSNCGNTCYISSVIKAYSRVLGNRISSASSNSIVDAFDKRTLRFREFYASLVNMLNLDQDVTMMSRAIFSAFKREYRDAGITELDISGNGQQDAYELLVSLSNGLMESKYFEAVGRRMINNLVIDQNASQHLGGLVIKIPEVEGNLNLTDLGTDVGGPKKFNPSSELQITLIESVENNGKKVEITEEFAKNYANDTGFYLFEKSDGTYFIASPIGDIIYEIDVKDRASSGEVVYTFMEVNKGEVLIDEDSIFTIRNSDQTHEEAFKHASIRFKGDERKTKAYRENVKSYEQKLNLLEKISENYPNHSFFFKVKEEVIDDKGKKEKKYVNYMIKEGKRERVSSLSGDKVNIYLKEGKKKDESGSINIAIERVVKSDAIVLNLTLDLKAKNAPNDLLVLLSRFAYKRNEPVKVYTKIMVGDTYDLATVHGDQRYRLVSYVVHFGGSKGGHYVAYIKSEKDGKWYKHNDSSVVEVKPEDAPHSQASSGIYILFYEKEGS